jgi:16S rRNA processing protein RimM
MHPEQPDSPQHQGVERAPVDKVIIGRIGSAYGVGGAMHVRSFTEPPENLGRYRPWWLAEGSGFRRVEVASFKAHGNGFVARIRSVDDRDRAQALAGSLIAVDRASLPPLEPDEEFYWRDLIGLSVVDTAGAMLGKVTRLLDTGAHDVLVIQGERETLIPFLAEFVLEVDLVARRILVEWTDPI